MSKSKIAALTQASVSAIAALSLAFGAADAFAAQLLINPGFETGSFAGWTVGGNSSSVGVAADGTATVGADPPFPPNFVNVRSGTFAGFALVKDGFDPVERIILTQTIAVAANSLYSVGFWLGNDSQSGFGMFEDNSHTQIFINGVGLLSGIIDVPIDVPNGTTAADFIQLTSSFNSGPNTSLTVAFAINGSGLSHVNASFDDFSVVGPAATSVPEPATLALLGLGLFGLGWSRRKKA